MATCILRIGDRVALSSIGGGPEVEYALFDPGEIELAATGPGMVQEVGYQTSAEDAIARLKEGGVTWPLVLETASAMQPTVAMAYARGSSVRRIATSLGPAELFDGYRYDPATKVYEGRWLDLPALALDAEIPRLTQALQAMHLLALLRELNPPDPVQLVTREYMAGARPGGRSFKRYAFVPSGLLPATLREFAAQLRSTPHLDRAERAVGPTSPELLDILRDRIILSPDTDSQDRLRAIERAVGIRQRPLRGPLSDPDIWALEEQLSMGRPEGVTELIEALEKSKGKQPATAYLRVRAALISGREDPRAIAEKIAALSLSMPSFVELELLAAEAWCAAGEPKRALPFTRDLIANATVNDELRVRESQQLAARRPSQIFADGSAEVPRPSPLSIPSTREPPPATRDLTVSVVETALDSSDLILEERETIVPPLDAASASAEPFELETSAASPRRPTSVLPAPLRERPTAPPLRPRTSTLPSPPASRPEPASSRRETPPMMFGVADPSRVSAAPAVPTTRSPGGAMPRRISGTWVGPPPKPAEASPGRATELNFGAVPPQTPAPSPPSGNPRPALSQPPPSPERTTARPSAEATRLANRTTTELMRGASQPPFRSDSPDAHVHVPRAAPVPHFDDVAEAAGALSLPEGLSGVPDPIELLPRTVIDARVQFTFRSRELGREYDEELGIVLRADISGIEAMQRVLLERYTKRAVTTPEAAADIRRHGAFLSEILARSFGAFWVDIGPSDVGYWAMVVPPGTRVWPFGRVLRLIAMQHNERDLVSYFLELQGRAGDSD